MAEIIIEGDLAYRVVAALETIAEAFKKNETRPAVSADKHYYSVPETASALFLLGSVDETDPKLKTNFFTMTLKNFGFLERNWDKEARQYVYCMTTRTRDLPGFVLDRQADPEKFLAKDVQFDIEKVSKLFDTVWRGGVKQFQEGYRKNIDFNAKNHGGK